MEEYIVSARKYRPTTFDTVVGQEAITTTLKNTVRSGKLAHAYLFCGPRGVGKTTCARIFAKAINCMSPTTNGEACNECESCKAFNEQRSYNIFELDAASNNKVDDIRVLMEQTRIPPQVGKYKVFIIDEVHMLSQAAFNAFLKTLEEPPAHVIFILATTEKQKILPTIISRCQIFDFERMTVARMINHLKAVAEKEGITCEEEALSVIAEKADGGMRDALSIFDQAASFCQGNITYEKVIEDLNVLDAEYYFRITDNALANNVSDTLLLLGSITNRGFDGGNLINGLATHIRNVLMAKDESTLPLLETSEHFKQKYKEQAQKCPTPFLYTALRLLTNCDLNYKQSTNKRLLTEITLIEMSQITQNDDEPAAGRSPKRLKILFKNIKTSDQEHSQAVQVSQSSSDINARKIEKKISKATEKTPQTSVSISGFGVTFASLTKQKDEEEGDEIEETRTTNTRLCVFTQEDLLVKWRSMCNNMPSKDVAMAARMRNMTPVIKNFPNIEVVVDNQILLDQLNKIKPRITQILAKELGNEYLNITIRIADENEVTKILSDDDKLEKILSDNYPARMLLQTLDLELE